MMHSHILVVEDERHLGIGIKFNLEAESYRVTLVEDGPTALQLMESKGDTVDLIILDLMLPGMSGYTVCERLREAGRTLPVLMLSARTLAEDRARGFDVGANQYMNKPFELDELISRVKNLLQSRVQQLPGDSVVEKPVLHVYEFGSVSMNFDMHVCSVDGVETRMTSKEVKLLRYFVENPNRVISRFELLTEVWEMPGHLQTRAVDQFIARLRKIIEVDSGKPAHLLTVRDAGYRFVPDPNAE